MKIFKQILLILILALAVIACEDEATNPDVKKPEQQIDTVIAIPVGIDTCEYALVTELVGYRRINSVVYLPEFNYGFRLSVKFKNDSSSSNFDSLSICSGNHKFSYNKEELNAAYSAALNGFVFDLIYKIHELDCDSVIVWQIKLYDNVAIYDYQIATDFSKGIRSHAPYTKWDSSNVLSLGINNFSDIVDSVYVRYLNSSQAEIASAKYAYNSEGIKANNVPANAAYYYYTIENNLSGIDRCFTSLKYQMPDKPSGKIKMN